MPGAVHGTTWPVGALLRARPGPVATVDEIRATAAGDTALGAPDVTHDLMLAGPKPRLRVDHLR